MVRLGLFQAGLGMMSVLMLGILNRVMISELAIPPLVAAGVIFGAVVGLSFEAVVAPVLSLSCGQEPVS